MATTGDDFERLVDGVFSADEMLRLGGRLGAYGVEPVSPGREELLGHFDELLALLVASNDTGRQRSHQERFLGNVGLITDMRLGEPIKVGRVASYIANLACGGRGWGVLSSDADIFGDFSGFSIGPWYDVPREEPPEDESIYLREFGLMVTLEEPRIVYADGEADLLEGATRVPLNHGAPELYHVLH